MTTEEFKNLKLDQRVSMWTFNICLETKTLFGNVTKLYNGNHQCQVLFDGETKPRTVGKNRIEIACEKCNNTGRVFTRDGVYICFH